MIYIYIYSVNGISTPMQGIAAAKKQLIQNIKDNNAEGNRLRGA